MPSTTALFTGLSGLNANARNIDVIGNNIANVNTTAFKSSRLNFETMFSRTMGVGSAPVATSGGTNPYQIGLGVLTAGTQRNFNAGTISPTGDSRDMAISGDGFFIVKRDGKEFYTRAGNVRPDANQVLTTPAGERLQGYGVDANFNVAPGALKDVTIPVGALTLAQATQNVHFRGNLNANGELPTRGARIDLTGTASAGLLAIAGAAPAPGAGHVLETTSRLVDIEDPALPASGTPMFTAGQTIELRTAEKGGKTIPTATLAIASATTVQDLNDFLTAAIGINTTTGANPDGRTPGVSLNAATGAITLDGNTGTVSDLTIDPSDIRLLSSSGALVRSPFVATKTAAADGESVRTTFIAYDSLGTPVEIDMSMVLSSRDSSGTHWRYMVESADDSDLALQIGTGMLDFDTTGQLATRTAPTVSLDRAGSGADTPLTISLSFSSGQDNVSALTDAQSQIAATYRDGSPLGVLSGFGVGSNGTITGSFSNGLTRTIGQVVLATFANDEGLVDQGANLFTSGPNSGTPVITVPGTLGSGQVVGGSLELSNVDLGEEFIKMILSSTGYSASSRVIKTTDDLMQQLLVLGR